MAKKGIVVCQGALCQCTLAAAPVLLKVVTLKKHFVNDNKAIKKLTATEKEKTVASLNFGTCRPGTLAATPCAALLTWKDFYDKIVIEENMGMPLIDCSTAMCVMGGRISILHHGQTAIPTPDNFKRAQPDIHSQLNPLVNPLDIEKQDSYEGLTLKSK